LTRRARISIDEIEPSMVVDEKHAAPALRALRKASAPEQ
jgi:hypothetical protein